MTELCKHDWTGDEECAYCKCEELERQLAAKDAWIEELETSNPAWELLISTQNEVVKWKKEVIKWQDTDTESQEKIEVKDAEIADLKHGFIDVDAAFEKDARIKRLEQAIQNTLDTGMTRYIKEGMDNEMTETKPGMPSFTEEQIRGWIREEEDVIRAWIVDEMKRFFNLANKAQMDQQIKVIEACGFKVIPEEAPAPASGDDNQGPDDSKMSDSISPKETIDQIKANSYYEPDDNSGPRNCSKL